MRHWESLNTTSWDKSNLFVCMHYAILYMNIKNKNKYIAYFIITVIWIQIVSYFRFVTCVRVLVHVTPILNLLFGECVQAYVMWQVLEKKIS